ncbi:helix-turn-helix domain-containing protein [Carnobacterium funditum]|uniref:helix-turn-helix domain-containing protein n=1 Tax=Carnobacterium funditum TaxID=2752 RepID=UPI0024816631|nr:helix-turn-helix domain-containing protein [Carnobacterium funditum]
MDKQKVKDALRLYDSGQYSVKDIIRITGISQGSLYRKIKERESKNILKKLDELAELKP